MGNIILERPAVHELPIYDAEGSGDTQHDHEPLYSVVLHNDPINTIEFVVQVLRKVFGYGQARAVYFTLQAHLTGRSAVWSGRFEAAELKANQIRGCGPDPTRVAAGAGPLGVSLERVR